MEYRLLIQYSIKNKNHTNKNLQKNYNTLNNYFLKRKDDNFETPLGFFVLLVESVLSVLSFKSDFLFLIFSVF